MKIMQTSLRRAALWTLALFIFSVSPLAAEAQTSKPRFSGKNQVSVLTDARLLERKIFEAINKIREDKGLSRLLWNEKAAQAARVHSTNMAGFGFFSHVDLDGGHVNQRASAAGIKDWEMVGENIAYNNGFENPVERAVAGWMNSAGHRRNILRDNWRETGVGIAVSPAGTFFFTQVFLKRS